MQVFQRWQPRASHLDIAVTPNSNKAFVHWSAEGSLAEEGGSLARVFGLNMLVFDPKDGRVQEAVGFRCAGGVVGWRRKASARSARRVCTSQACSLRACRHFAHAHARRQLFPNERKDMLKPGGPLIDTILKEQ